MKDLMWFYLLCALCSFRGTGGLYKTVFLAGNFFRHTLSPAVWYYKFFELQHAERQHGRERGEGEGWRE